MAQVQIVAEHDDSDDRIDQAVSPNDEEPPYVSSTPQGSSSTDPPFIGAAGQKGKSTLAATHRTAAEVLSDHLREGKHGSVERDLPRNYAENLVILTSEGTVHGHDGMRALAHRLRRELPEARFNYKAQVADQRIALLEWSAESPTGAYVEDGVDSYLIEDGRIVAQTIHYTVKQRARSGQGPTS